MIYLWVAFIVTWLIIIINWKLPQRVVMIYRTSIPSDRLLAVIASMRPDSCVVYDSDEDQFVVLSKFAQAVWGRGATIQEALWSAVDGLYKYYARLLKQVRGVSAEQECEYLDYLSTLGGMLKANTRTTE